MHIKALTMLVLLALLIGACASESVFQLDVGTCFDDPGFDAKEVTSVPLVDCEEPHDNEVYFLFNVTNTVFPGDDSLSETAADGCFNEFESFVGLEYSQSILDFSWFAPTAESWEEGDREVICFVYDLDLKKLTGTMARSAA